MKRHNSWHCWSGGQRLLIAAPPGSKTFLIAKGNREVKVVASDLHPHRTRLLRERITAPNLRVLAADARHLPFGSGFDRILADVPCSGTGTLARNPEIKWRLIADDLLDLQTRQSAILKAALDALTSGGRLVYSTCSLEREENESVVEAVLAATTEFKLVNCRFELEQLQRSGELGWKDLDSLLTGSYLRTVPESIPATDSLSGWSNVVRRVTSAISDGGPLVRNYHLPHLKTHIPTAQFSPRGALRHNHARCPGRRDGQRPA